jgi:uridine kinase
VCSSCAQNSFLTDLKIFLDVDFVVAVQRSCLRDPEFLTRPRDVLVRCCNRYMAGNRIYLESIRPVELADVVVNNNDIENPTLRIKTSETP